MKRSLFNQKRDRFHCFSRDHSGSVPGFTGAELLITDILKCILLRILFIRFGIIEAYDTGGCHLFQGFPPGLIGLTPVDAHSKGRRQ